MNYTEFMNAMLCEIRGQVDAQVRTELYTVTKNNGTRRRAAIVSAINEVSDENNTYNQTKADIQAAQKSINADVTKNQQIQQTFNSNLQQAKEVQKDLAAKMNTGTALAENLEKKNTTATSLDKSLGEKNTAATKTVQTLEADITAANTAAKTLEADTAAANKAELTPYPMKESINPDGTISPFMIHAKYAAGDIDGVPYSSKGLAPANGCQATQARNPVSYTGMITYMHKLGGHYCGTTSLDLFYRQLMMIIKYATTHSQSIMAGCTSYSNQNQNLVEETGVMRVVLTKAQAAGYVIGSYVSIGDVGSNTNKDRYYSYMHNKAYSVKVTKIEDVDDSNAAVYVDAPEAFDTTLTTWITTMPWHSGATDEVAGSDGSPNSNTNGKDPYKIQGIETCIGAYEVLGNVVMDIVTGTDGNPARDVYVCEDASTLSSNIATVRANYKKAIAQVAYTAASWKYITEETTDPNLGIMIPTKVGGGSTTGFADGLYTDTGASGQREWLALGSLGNGALAGLWVLSASHGWSSTYWSIVSGVSPNGTRGEWQATA